MSGLGINELLIILSILFIIILTVVGILFLIKIVLKPGKPDVSGNQSSRLKELQKLMDKDLITEQEYNKKRDEILDSL